MKLILLSTLIMFFVSALMAQDTISSALDTMNAEQVKPIEETQTSKPPPSQAWKDKIYFGGYVNFSLGSYAMVGIAPMVGYKVLPFLSLGLKLRYEYISDNRYSETYNTSNYGGSLFARLASKRRIYLHAEYAGYNYELYDESGELGREWVPYLFLGGDTVSRWEAGHLSMHKYCLTFCKMTDHPTVIGSLFIVWGLALDSDICC